MLESKRKTRLFALSSIVCLQAGPPRQTLRARRICSANAIEHKLTKPNQPGLGSGPIPLHGTEQLEHVSTIRDHLMEPSSPIWRASAACQLHRIAPAHRACNTNESGSVN